MSIHGHDVLTMMIESGEQYSEQSLIEAIHARFVKPRVFIPVRHRI